MAKVGGFGLMQNGASLMFLALFVAAGAEEKRMLEYRLSR
jgi:hypothetical protein